MDHHIDINKIVKNYQSGETTVRALRGVDLHIKAGSFISIAGPSGSGKTTLLNILGCIDKADEGEVSISGRTISHLEKKDQAAYRRENLGFVFQSYNLIPVLTAFENVALSLNILGTGEEETRRRTMEVLKEVGLEGMEHRLPSALSGGQQQRVAVARALVKNPAVVLADEPTANLDSVTGQAILELMKEMNKKHGTTFIFSTHDKMVMDFADRLVLLRDGQIVDDQEKTS